MKKLVALSLVCILVLSLCACSGAQKEEIKAKLTGPWGYTTDDDMYIFFIFSYTGTVEFVASYGDIILNNWVYEYEINEKEIIITNNSGETERIISYTYSGGKLSLVDKYKDGTGNDILIRAE